MVEEKDLVFVSFVAEDYSRSAVLRGKMNKSKFILVPRPSLKLVTFLIDARQKRKLHGKTLVVMSPCHILVLYLRLTLKCKIVLDAGWPLLDGAVSRNFFNSPLWRIKYLKFWLVDFISFQLADAVAFESEAQKKKSVKQFVLNEEKVFTSYSGFAENQIEPISGTDDCLLADICPKCQTSKYKIILFRGKYNSEAGIELIDRAAAEINQTNVKFVFATSSIPAKFVLKSKSNVIEDFITYNQMRHLYEIATLAVGQVSEDIRLQFTIPHKVFEAGYFGTPYLTRDAAGVREIFPLSTQAIFYDPADTDLTALFSSVINDQNLLDNVSKSAKKRYKEVASQSVIAENFLKNVNSHCGKARPPNNSC